MVVAALQGDDIILCQITSKARTDEYSIMLSGNDFIHGGLNKASVARPNRLFTADKSIVLYKAGALKQAKVREVEESLVRIMSA